MEIQKRIKYYVESNVLGQGRSSIVKRNAFFSVILKALSVATSLLLVPISIRFVGSEQYGIWLTISSMVTWLSLFDIGLSNGLRNRLVKALDQDDNDLARTYVSTTYIVLSFIFVGLWLIFCFANKYIDWVNILSISNSAGESVRQLILIIFSYFCLTFILKIINTILLADQKAAYSSLIDTIGQFLSLIIVCAMYFLLPGSLLYLCIGLCASPLVVAILFNINLFNKKYKKIAPSLKYFKLWCIKDLIGLSFKFFIIQIAAIIQYQTANLIIAHYFNMSEVTNYNTAFKYFSVLNIIFAMLLMPLWSASTDAYNKNEYQWIINATKKYLKVLLLLSIAGIIMLIASNLVYNIWIGNKYINIPFNLSLWCLIYILITLFGSIFVNILNGIGAIRIQLISSVFTPFLYLILALVFIKYLDMGIYSLFIASIIANINGFIFAPIQFMKVFIQKKKGIWIA